MSTEILKSKSKSYAMKSEDANTWGGIRMVDLEAYK